MRLRIQITPCRRQHLALGVSSIYYTFWLFRESNLQLICPSRSQLQKRDLQVVLLDFVDDDNDFFIELPGLTNRAMLCGYKNGTSAAVASSSDTIYIDLAL